VNFLFDNNLSPNLAQALHRLVEPEHQVKHLIEKFRPNTPDTEWMATLATEADWFVVTADVRIGKNPHEVKAWKEAGHTIFFLKPGWLNLDFWTQAWKFTKCFPQILSQGERAPRGSAFLVTVNGNIDRLS
jgi:hypothetical protein